MTWVEVKWTVGMDVRDPKDVDFTIVLGKISRIISECLNIADDKMITTFDHVDFEKKVME